MEISYKEVKYDDLSTQENQCVIASQRATAKSYSPYSNFKVGAAALMSDGNIFVGANQENSSFTAGICAERALIYNSDCINGVIDTISISAMKDGEIVDCAPCGVCRQSLLEVEIKQKKDIKLIFRQNGNYIITENVRCLLPFAFSEF
ncbi:MAG: cytidine deaminase [Rikenellaceae bacterium]